MTGQLSSIVGTVWASFLRGNLINLRGNNNADDVIGYCIDLVNKMWGISLRQSRVLFLGGLTGFL